MNLLRIWSFHHIIPVSAFGAAILALVIGVSGCITTRIERVRQANASINDEETIVVLPRHHEFGEETEESFLSCLSRALNKGNAVQKVFPKQQFVDRLFPWFEPRIAPSSPMKLKQVLTQPGVNEQIAATGVRYLVWIDGDTDKTDDGGAISCAVGPAGGGCFGFAWWEKDSEYEVSIWDLKYAEAVGTISADISGISYMPAVIVPIPLIARTQAAACKEEALQLRELMGMDEN